MLLGTEILVYSDHKNLTFDKLSSQCILCWCCYCDEYNLTIKHISGKENILADCLSRLPRLGLDEGTEGESSPTDPVDDSHWIDEAYDAFHSLDEDMDFELADSFDCFLNFPTTVPEESPLEYEWICEQQQADEALLAKHRWNP